MSGVLRAIAIAPKKRAPMEERERAAVSEIAGIEGDARGRRAGRQVTVLFEDAWSQACRDLGATLPWTTRRANLLVAGMVAPRTVGARLTIGAIELEVTEETKPCGLMERAVPGLKAALKPDWRGGVYCRVVRGGEIAIGDAVSP